MSVVAIPGADGPARRQPLDSSGVEALGDPELLSYWLEHSRLEPV
jgi:hypothetical protein